MKFGDAKRLMRGIQLDEADLVADDGRPVVNIRAKEGKVVVELGELTAAEPGKVADKPPEAAKKSK